MAYFSVVLCDPKPSGMLDLRCAWEICTIRDSGECVLVLEGRDGNGNNRVVLLADDVGLMVKPSGDVVVIVGWASGDGLSDRRL